MRLRVRERPPRRAPVMYQKWHRPYQLAEVEVSDLKESLLGFDGFSEPAAAPDHKIMSPGVEVDILAWGKSPE
jgi:uncharacterized protein YqjF (DUF2071 family)